MNMEQSNSLGQPWYLGPFIITACGMLGVTAIAVNAFGIVPLYFSGPWFVLPGFVLILVWALLSPGLRKIVARGFFAGLLAVLLYDISRLFFMQAGWLDFIPKIGDWLFNRKDVHPMVGYSWRYIANGGGLGITFAMLSQLVKWKSPGQLTRYGIIYGLFIFSGLMLTLWLSPHGAGRNV